MSPVSSDANTSDDPDFAESLALYMRGDNALRRLTAVGLGTLAFGMQDVLLEPYGGEILGLSVSETTRLTATLAAGGLAGFTLASFVLSRGADPFRMAGYGALAGMLAFTIVISSAEMHSPRLFVLGAFLIGFGGGLFGHGTLTATMNFAPKDQTGLALGAWGAVQATAAGIGVALGGAIRDGVKSIGTADAFGPAASYDAVYLIEILLLAATLAAMFPLVSQSKGPAAVSGIFRGLRTRRLDLQTNMEQS